MPHARLLTVLVLSLAACAPKLVKEGVTEEQAARDTQECRYQASLATASMTSAVDRALRQNDLVGECLRVRGYR